MSGISTESPQQVIVNDDGPDEFDVAMDAFASGTKPPADAMGAGAVDPNGAGNDDDTLPGSDQEAGVSEPAAGAAPPADDQSTTDDIWANAPPELKQAYEASQRDAEYRLNSIKGRLSASDRELARLRAAQQARQPEPSRTGNDNGGKNPFDPEAMTKLREEYGEIAGPLLDMMDALRGNVDQLKQPVAVIEQEQQLAQYNQQVEALEAQHPDWQTAFGNEAFPAWLEKQPAMVRSAIERNANSIVDGQEAAYVLDLFKRDIGAGSTPPPPPGQQQQDQNRLSERRQRQLEAGRDAASRSGQSATSGVPDDFDSAMDAYAAKADAGRKR